MKSNNQTEILNQDTESESTYPNINIKLSSVFRIRVESSEDETVNEWVIVKYCE